MARVEAWARLRCAAGSRVASHPLLPPAGQMVPRLSAAPRPTATCKFPSRIMALEPYCRERFNRWGPESFLVLVFPHRAVLNPDPAPGSKGAAGKSLGWAPRLRASFLRVHSYATAGYLAKIIGAALFQNISLPERQA